MRQLWRTTAPSGSYSPCITSGSFTESSLEKLRVFDSDKSWFEILLLKSCFLTYKLRNLGQITFSRFILLIHKMVKVFPFS